MVGRVPKSDSKRLASTCPGHTWSPAAPDLLGSHVVVDLLTRGNRVVVFDNLQQGHREAVHGDATLVVGDLSDCGALRQLFSNFRFDGILHFAANSLVGESMRKPFLYIGDNVTNALNLVRAALESDVRRFVLSSTCAIFGLPSRVPIDEEVDKNPANPYGESKLIIERILRWADEVHGLRSACLRYFNAAGAHPDVPIGEDHSPETHLIPIALEAVLGHRPHVEIFGDDYATPDGTCIRDYIHVCDLSDAHVRVLDALDEGSCHLQRRHWPRLFGARGSGLGPPSHRPPAARPHRPAPAGRSAGVGGRF